MKILIVHNIYKSRGGEEQSVEQMKTLFEKTGHIIITYFLDNNQIENFSLLQKILLPFRTVFSLKTYKEILELVSKEKPDIALIQNIFPLISPSIYYALKKRNVPVIQRVSNYRFLCPNGLFLNSKGEICELCKKGNYLNGIIRRCYRNSFKQTSVLVVTLYLHRFLKTFTNNVDIFISPSKFLKNKLIEAGFPKHKIVVINNIVSSKKIKPFYNFENYAVYMGRLSKEKGLFTLLRAFRGISDFTLKIIGSGPLEDKLKSFVENNKLANIEFLGFISGTERFEILKRAMFMIIPSEWYECFPNVVLESFAVGTPVVGSQIGGISEQIIDGENGLLFLPRDEEDLRKKILILIENPELASKMRYYAIKTAKRRYSQEIAYKNFMNIYSKLIYSNK